MANQELSLTISERLAAAQLFNEFKGDLSKLSLILDDVKACAVSQADLESAPDAKKSELTDGGSSWTWTEAGSEKAVSLSSEGVDYLKEKIASKGAAKEFSLADKAIVPLSDKLK